MTKARSYRMTFVKLVLFLLVASNRIQSTNAILPTAAIDVTIANDSQYTLLASQGNFAPYLPMTPSANQIMTSKLPPENDPLLCRDIQNIENNHSKLTSSPFVYIVPRGSCTFEHKTLVAQLYGAEGVIIYGTLSSRYGYNTTTNEIDYPKEYYDYDCSVEKGGGKVDIPKNKLIGFTNDNSNDNKYDAGNDKLLSGGKGSGNLCALYSNNNQFETNCPSQKCLLTGNQTTSTTMEACCAWDTHIFLYKDDTMSDPKSGKEYQPITIPSFYITMDEGDKLLNSINTYGNNNISLIMYSRWYPKYNLSTIVIWMVGVFVAALASYLSASEIRDARKNIEKRAHDISDHMNDSTGAVSMRGYERISNTQGEGVRRSIAPEETLELTASHAIFFVLFSTAGLLTLFFFKIYSVVKVFYAFGCSGAMIQVIVLPFYYYIVRKINLRDRVIFTNDDFGPVSIIDILAIITSYGLGAAWLYIAFTHRHADTIPFFWIMQDIFGACMCIMFLQTMKLNSIKVASILLTAAFFYDIFFVFVTPFLTKGGKSIMVDVATSGGPPTADPSWCEKYPDGPECQGGDPLPMLFTIPRINDYAGGSSLLGLGDIVLPGLLLSFASRYDEAKRLIGAFHSPRSHEDNCSRNIGYFIPSVIAYAIGLGMANVAVYVMHMGQPALLYLVPCCLGVIVYLGWKRGELTDLWNTPKVLISCDTILYGSEENESSQQDEDSQEEPQPTREVM